MSKKTFVLLFGCLLLFVFAACGDDDNNTSSSSSVSTASETSASSSETSASSSETSASSSETSASSSETSSSMTDTETVQYAKEVLNGFITALAPGDLEISHADWLAALDEPDADGLLDSIEDGTITNDEAAAYSAGMVFFGLPGFMEAGGALDDAGILMDLTISDMVAPTSGVPGSFKFVITIIFGASSDTIEINFTIGAAP